MRLPWPFRRRKRLTLDLPKYPDDSCLAGDVALDPEHADHVPMTAHSASAWTEPSRAQKRRDELGLPHPGEPPPPTLHSVLLQCEEALEERDRKIAALESEVSLANRNWTAVKNAEQAACKLVTIAHAERERCIADLYQVDLTLDRLAREFGMTITDFDDHRKTLIDWVMKHKIEKLRRAHTRALKRIKRLTGK